MTLIDGFGRSFHYLRLSVEDVCNFRCRYCPPHGYHKTEADSALSVAETAHLTRAFAERARLEGDRPARASYKSGYSGEVGIVAPYAKEFCGSCNRLRVTSRGRLRLCLFSEADHSLRSFLKDDSQSPELQERINTLLGLKEVLHHLPEGKMGNTKHFAMMEG